MYHARNLLYGVLVTMLLGLAPCGLNAGSMPDSVELDSLVDLYDKVTFDHSKHVMLVENCSECHHHTTGTSVTDRNCARCHRNSGVSAIVACKGCHKAKPFSASSMRHVSKAAYHTDRLGLKGAYHQGCTGCHEKMGGPTGCQDCHVRKTRGDAFFSTGGTAQSKTKGKGTGNRH